MVRLILPTMSERLRPRMPRKQPAEKMVTAEIFTVSPVEIWLKQERLLKQQESIPEEPRPAQVLQYVKSVETLMAIKMKQIM